MDRDTNRICQQLTNLADDLQSARNDAYEYIELMARQLSCAETVEKVRNLLVQIKSSAKMIDYANFTARQERKWNEIWNEAERILQHI